MKLIAAALLLTTAASPAFAQSASGGAMTIFGYNVNASLRAKVSPTYEGSDDYRIGPAGSISLSKPGTKDVFSASDDGFSWSLFGGDSASAGVTGRLRGGRDNKDDLRGMRKIDWAGEAGVFVNLWPTDWLRTRLEVRKGFGGHEGVVADLSADAVARPGHWVLSVGPRFSYADAEFTRTYFGVTPSEAAASPFGIGAYKPDGGPRSVGVQAGADYKWNARWRITSEAGYDRLLGDAADSPLVRTLGDRDQFSGSIGVRYAFGG